MHGCSERRVSQLWMHMFLHVPITVLVGYGSGIPLVLAVGPDRVVLPHPRTWQIRGAERGSGEVIGRGRKKGEDRTSKQEKGSEKQLKHMR